MTTLLLAACKGRPMGGPEDADTPASREIVRYDRLVDEFVSLNSFTSLRRMNTEYPNATRLLIEDVLGIGSVEEPLIEQRLRTYYLDSTLQVLLQDVHHCYHDLRHEERELFGVFDRIKADDPQFKIPMVYTQVSGLNQSIVVGDSLLGISLDKYLGRDYPLYLRYYHDWQRIQMGRDRLVPDALYFYLSHEYPLPPSEVHTLLDFMVNGGKLHWVIAHYRGVDLYRQSGFATDSLEWYRSHEHVAWKWLNAQQALSMSDMTLIKRFMQPRASTPYLGDASHDRIGLWLGLRIVEEYVRRHPQVKPIELLRMTDYKTFLKESGYDPLKP